MKSAVSRQPLNCISLNGFIYSTFLACVLAVEGLDEFNECGLGDESASTDFDAS